MNDLKIIDNYYVHETIMKKINYNKYNNSIEVFLNFCEWQIEELLENKDNCIGLKLVFNDVDKISSKAFFDLSDEYVLMIKIKNSSVEIMLDDDQCSNVEFNYSKVQVEQLF